MDFYPLIFIPIFKERIWGGHKLKDLFDKNIPNDTIGESWELSTLEDNVSQIASGSLQGMLFTDVIEQYPKEILGSKILNRFGEQFPLLFKLLDASDDLSIQVHPNDALARERHNSFGKTEMWYIIQSDKGSRNIIGFNQPITSEDYVKHLQEKNLSAILQEEPVEKGDVFLLHTGTVHAIGKGIVLAEIQQTSDITYRIYDWDRVDASGKERELHLDLAKDAINYNVTNARVDYAKENDQANPVVSIDQFTVNYIPLTSTKRVTKSDDCFRVYMCLEGSFSIEVNNTLYSFKKGVTVFIPAAITTYQLQGSAELLEVYI